MAEPASESSVPKPDDFHSQLLELLEDESSTEESSCGKEAISRRHRSSTAKKMIKNGKRPDRDDESVNRDEKGTVSKPWRKMEAIDSSSSRLHRRISLFEAQRKADGDMQRTGKQGNEAPTEEETCI
ncbi:uncharacterized protein N7469_002129 [Penicillium citrinum]|uniref:Uncharacterized protein n=1 Tax=Penicillium citrinum TaxID=5077 RepID=A0A9W9PC46_PENCI|nr:uncharacterized protein N7469_002129 [Penicillium citrinum]KAJ5240538.1 hypothetical protein N7469_002129 [Penicillium citrinum]